MFLYIDPGTGSMLFSILIGVVSTVFFFGRQLYLKLKFIISGGKTEKLSNTKLPVVIFSDHKRYWNVFKPICEELEKRNIDAVYWTASPDDPALTQNYNHVKCEFIGEGNKSFSRLNMLNAGIVLATTPGLNVYQWKKSKNVQLYVHVFHEVGEPMGYRMFGLDFYDSVLLSGDFQANYIRYIEEKRNLPAKELTTVGCTYFDEIKTRLEQNTKSKNQSNSKTVLLAPSWGSTAILSRYGEKIIKALVDTDFNIIIRPHPQSKTSEKELLDSLMNKYPETELLHWNFDNDNFDVLNESDILISDFSGVIFDFALCFDKPIIYADINYDSSPYDAAWMEEELWRFKVLPDLGIQLKESDFSNLKQIIENLISNEKYSSGRERIRKEAWSNQGKAASAIVDYLQNKLSEIYGEK